MNGAHEVRVEKLADNLDGNVLDRAHTAEARIVHQHVDAAEAVRGGGNRLVPIDDDADVQRQGKEPARIPFHELVERLWIACGRDDLMPAASAPRPTELPVMNHVCAIGTSVLNRNHGVDKCLALRRKKALWCNRRTRKVIKNGRYQFTEDCDRVAETLRRIGDKWSVLIIVLLELGPRRFNDLKRSIPGISQRMLTLTTAPPPQFGH
jgi:HxlR-like helix-turn-helix